MSYPFIERLRQRSEEQMERLSALRGQCKEKMADKAEQWKSFKEQRAIEWNNFWNADRSFKFGTGSISEMAKDAAQSEPNTNETSSQDVQKPKSRWMSWSFTSVSECSEGNCKTETIESSVESEPKAIETSPAPTVVANTKKSGWW